MIVGDVAWIILLAPFVVALSLTEWEWRCGLCGKMNTTNTFKFIFQMCDHEGQI